MTRALLFGFGPLPNEGLRVAGPSLRTWHLTRALLDAGHEVCLIGDRMAGLYPEDLPRIVTKTDGALTYHSVHDMAWHDPNSLRPLIAAFRPACAIAVTTPAAGVAADNCGDLPLWCDLYGSIMAEAQLKALVYGDDSHLTHFWNMERRALERGDVFSTVSDRQKWATVGELGLWGRLSQWTSGYVFVHTIPIAAELTPFTASKPVIRGVLCDSDTFVILYTGGYNTWTDVDTLFAALERVFAAQRDVIFVSTGGRITGHDEFTFARFEALIERSPYRARYHLRGWVPPEDIPAYYLESDVAVNVDRFSYETLLGSRTRILDWLRAGLPPISSDLTELAQEVAAYGAGLTYRAADPADLAAALTRLITDKLALAVMRHKTRQLLAERYTFEITARELLSWAANPTHAPDYGRERPKLAMPYRNTWAEIRKMIKRRRLNLSFAVRLWPLVAATTNALRLHGLQRRLASLGQRALRLDETPYRAEYSAVAVPDKVQAGANFTARVTVKNVGGALWLPIGISALGVNMSYHWLDEAGRVVVWDGLRTALPTAVEKGQSVTVTFTVAAPSQPGRYQLELDLVREGVTWFSQAASPGPQVKVGVE